MKTVGFTGYNGGELGKLVDFNIHIPSFNMGMVEAIHSVIMHYIIEEINTDSIKSGYSSALFNKRGSSTRGPFDGGDIERGHAEYFEKLAADNKIKFPKVAEIFKQLSEGYLMDAKRMDEQAERDRLEY